MIKVDLSRPRSRLHVIVLLLAMGLTIAAAPSAESPPAIYASEFYLVFGGVLTRLRGSEFTFSESFRPVLTEAEARKLVREVPVPEPTLYRIETVANDGTKAVYRTAVYQESGSSAEGVTSLLTRRFPETSARAHYDPVAIPVTQDLRRINVYVGRQLVKSLERPPTVFKLQRVTQQPASGGVVIAWEMDNQSGMVLCVNPQFRVGENRWVSWPTRVGASHIDVDPWELDTLDTQVDFRLIVTDGFYAQVWTEPEWVRR